MDKTRDLLQQIIEIINPREKATSDRVRTLNGRLKDYTAEEVIGAAVAFSHSQWHKDHNQMSVDNLIRPSKFGRWYAQRKMEPMTPHEREQQLQERMG